LNHLSSQVNSQRTKPYFDLISPELKNKISLKNRKNSFLKNLFSRPIISIFKTTKKINLEKHISNKYCNISFEKPSGFSAENSFYRIKEEWEKMKKKFNKFRGLTSCQQCYVANLKISIISLAGIADIVTLPAMLCR